MRTHLAVATILLMYLPQLTKAQVSGPLLGFEFDEPAGIVRPVWGTPGAAWTGDPLETGLPPLAAGAGSAARRYILAAVRDEPRVFAVRLEDGVPVCREVPGVRPGRTVISPGGSYAAVYSQDAVQVIGGLPDSPAMLYEAAAGPGVSALAVSDRGAVLYGVEGALYVAEENSVRFLMPAGRPSAAVFFRDSDDAVVADQSANALYRLRSFSAELIAAEADGLAEPALLAVSRDGRRAFVAGLGSTSVTVVALADRAVSHVAVPAPVRAMEPMAGEAVFRLTGVSEYPAWILDAEGSTLRTWFIPAPSLPQAPAGAESAQ